MHMGDMSLRELARRSNIGHQTLGRIVNGEANPNLETIEAVAKAIGVAPADLLAKPVERRYDIPADILKMLDGQGPEVFSAIRAVLTNLVAIKSPAKKRKA